MKLIIYILAAAALFAPSNGTAEILQRVDQSQYVQSSTYNCKAHFILPADDNGNISVPVIYQGQCESGLAEGYLNIRGKPLGAPDGVFVSISSTFVSGLPTGQTSIILPGRFTFDGTIENQNMIGRFMFGDFQAEGEYRNGRMYTGRVFRAESMGGGVNHFVEGQAVSKEDYNTATVKPTRYPAGSPEATLGYNSKGASVPYLAQPVVSYTPTMARIRIEGSKACLVDLPTKLFKINEAIMPGRCTDGLYTGKAELTLTPLTGNTLPKMYVSLRYEAGQIVGPVKAKYPDYKTTYEGTFLDWEPQDGQTLQSIGNDNYSVIQFQGGQQVNQFREYRQPSEETLMLRRIGRELLYFGAETLIRCVSGDCPFKRKKLDPVYQSQRPTAPPVIASNQQAEPAPVTNTDSGTQQPSPVLPRPEPEPVKVTVADVTAPASEGTPIPQSNSEPAPAVREPQPSNPVNPTGDLGNTNSPEFGGGTSEPAPEFRVGTNPPEVPAPQPAPPSIPEPQAPPIPAPIARDEPPSVPAPVQGGDIPAPVARDTNGVPPPAPSLPPPPVQPPSQSDTLDTGPVPSNPIPAPTPIIEPAPTQPAVDVANRPTPTPANNTAVNQIATPSVPYGLAPSGSSSTPSIVTNPVILRWSSVTGTDYYDFGISSEATGYHLVVDQRLTDTFYNGNLSPGKYRWNLRACNNQSVCSAFASQQYFEIPGAGNAQANTQSALSAPTQLYPTNQGELAFPVPIEWNRVTGATSYKVAVSDVTENRRLVEDDTVTTSNTLIPRNQKAGNYYEWDVQACNASGCSVRSRNAGFRTVAAKSDSCKIEVRFKPVSRISNHAFIITSDSNSTTYFRGGPAMREKTLSEILSDNSGNRPFGYIMTEIGSYSPGTPDWTLSPSGSQVIATVSGNCDLIDQNFGRTLTDIENSKILYDPIYKNSNSVIHETLERAGYKSISPAVGAIAWYSRLP